MTHTDLIDRLRIKGIQPYEKPNHHIRRMEVERIEAADALTAAQDRIEVLEGAIADALGRFQITHVHEGLRAVLDAADNT